MSKSELAEMFGPLGFMSSRVGSGIFLSNEGNSKDVHIYETFGYQKDQDANDIIYAEMESPSLFDDEGVVTLDWSHPTGFYWKKSAEEIQEALGHRTDVDEVIVHRLPEGEMLHMPTILDEPQEIIGLTLRESFASEMQGGPEMRVSRPSIERLTFLNPAECDFDGGFDGVVLYNISTLNEPTFIFQAEVDDLTSPHAFGVADPRHRDLNKFSRFFMSEEAMTAHLLEWVSAVHTVPDEKGLYPAYEFPER